MQKSKRGGYCKSGARPVQLKLRNKLPRSRQASKGRAHEPKTEWKTIVFLAGWSSATEANSAFLCTLVPLRGTPD